MRASARARLLGLAPLAIRTLTQILESPTTDPGVQLRAVKYVIALNGIRPGKLEPDRGFVQKALPSGGGGGGTPSPDDEIEELLARLELGP